MKNPLLLHPKVQEYLKKNPLDGLADKIADHEMMHSLSREASLPLVKLRDPSLGPKGYVNLSHSIIKEMVNDTTPINKRIK